ncbi:MAG: enoyl-CoA hydratase-related protein [Saprospiraceae bacterium]|nr:enoyl-CoA hydratase-related protein [Saprospiraceae bacterium]
MTAVILDIRDNIGFITIDRPKALNALNDQVFKDLDAIVTQIEEDKNVRAAIITGAGEKAFAAGADITQFKDLDAAGGEALSLRGQKVFRRIETSRLPYIAAVNGFALGGGCELAMACHIRLAAEEAKFGQPEVSLGLIPGYGGTQRLVQIVGKGRALEILLTGRMVKASEALQIGLVTGVFPGSDLMFEAEKTAKSILSMGRWAIKRTIEAVDYNFRDEDGFKKEAEIFGKAMASKESKEGVTAFLEKRKPDF